MHYNATFIQILNLVDKNGKTEKKALEHVWEDFKKTEMLKINRRPRLPGRRAGRLHAAEKRQPCRRQLAPVPYSKWCTEIGMLGLVLISSISAEPCSYQYRIFHVIGWLDKTF
jgi:hypothetical protein